MGYGKRFGYSSIEILCDRIAKGASALTLIFFQFFVWISANFVMPGIYDDSSAAKHFSGFKFPPSIVA